MPESRKTRSQRNACKSRRLPQIHCTLCWAVFIFQDSCSLIISYSNFQKEHLSLSIWIFFQFYVKKICRLHLIRQLIHVMLRQRFFFLVLLQNTPTIYTFERHKFFPSKHLLVVAKLLGLLLNLSL